MNAGVGQSTARPIFGRQRELEQLQAGLTQALAGRGRFFTVAGEPGIGKTRLLDELTEDANQRGVLVLWGRSWEAGGAPAYWPWIAVLEGLVRSLDDASLRDSLGPGAAALAALVPELESRLGPAKLATPPSADEARFRLWRAVAGLVRRAAQPAGLVLAFEDLHAADESSLALLHFLAREVRGQRLLLLASFRDAEAFYEPAVGQFLGRIGREGATLALGRLPLQASQALLEHRVGPLDPALAARICERAQGNPLFLEELSRLVDQAVPGQLGGTGIPLGVRELIRQRLDRLESEARGLLDLAAVIGDEIDPLLLAAASALPHAAVVARLAEAAHAGLVHGHAPRIRFSHALLREALYQGLPDDRRQALHGQVARALDLRSHAADPTPPRPAELAHHLLAGPRTDLPRAIDVAIAAARDALVQLGYQEAVQGLERAAQAVAAAGNPVNLRARVALALGEAHIRRGDLDVGRAFCREAARSGRSLGDRVMMAQAALTYGQVFTFGVVDPVLIDLLDEALAAFADGEDPLRISLHARLAAALQPSVRTQEPARIAREAIAGARRLGDPRVLLRTLQSALAALMDVAPPKERLALNLEAETLAYDFDDREALLRIQGRLVVDHMGMGDFAQADARIDAFEAQARQQQAPWVGWRAPLFRSMRAMLHGRFAESEALISEALRIGKGADSHDPQVDRCVALHRESLYRVAERHEDALAHDPICRQHRSDFFRAPMWHAMCSALLASRMEDADKTRFHLGLIPLDARPPVDNLYALFHITEPVALVGDPELVETLHTFLQASADEDVVLGMTQLSWEGPTVRLLALLEARLGRWNEAEAHFEMALRRLEERDARPLLARTRYEYGRAQLDRDPTCQAARDRIAAAAGEAEALGMAGLVRLARARLAPATALPSLQAAPAPQPVVMQPPPALRTGSLPFELINEGEVWAFRHGELSFRLKDSLGLRYLGRLLAEPDREVHVLDLVAAGGGATGESGEIADAGDSGELLDDEARASYRRRLEDLREQLAEAESFGDPGRAARAREELEFLTAELGRAVGLGGRVRRAGSAAERARSAVQRRIKNALGRIEGHAPKLAAYLGRTIKTGNFCAYRPGAAGDNG